MPHSKFDVMPIQHRHQPLFEIIVQAERGAFAKDCLTIDAAGYEFGLKHDFELPNGWETEVFDWLWDHDERSVENIDDQGGWPEESKLEAAFEALGYERAA